MTAAFPTLGAPGVYQAPDLIAAAPLGVRMDVCAFVGVAPRGPAWERSDDRGYDRECLLAAGRARSVPVAVQSWAEYTEVFGGFTGPGFLPYSVAAFFGQGGRQAWVMRVVPATPRPASAATAPPPGPDGPGVVLPPSEPPGCAVLAFDRAVLVGVPFGTVDDSIDPARSGHPVLLRARNEGTWGNRLFATLTFVATAQPALTVDAGALICVDGPAGAPSPVTTGDLLRVRSAAAPVALRAVTAVDRVAGRWRATLDHPIAGGPVRVEVITAALHVVDADPDHPREERFDGLGLRSAHPRWIGSTVAGSRLVELAQVTDGSGLAQDLVAITPLDPTLPAAVADRPADGIDRYPLITFDDVLGPLQVIGALPRVDGDLAPDGLDALAGLVDPADSAAPASVVVADLYQPFAAAPSDDVAVPATVAGAGFDECVTVPAVPASTRPGIDLSGLRLDPTVPGERARIVALQQRVVAAAEGLGLVALLDVPPGLRPAQVFAWRADFDSSSAAAWHGWLRVPAGDALATIPPTGYAAGLIAATERIAGPAIGPALQTLAGVVAVAEGPGAGIGTVDAGLVGRLHRAGLNLALPTRDGVEFSAARTLAGDPVWRQLTTRRVVTMVERCVATGLGWAVFEPNDRVLRERISTAVSNLLGELFATGAFAGGTPAESYFVRTSPVGGGAPGGADLVCEIGVAPSEPTEFILVRVLRTDDGTLRTQVGR